MAATNNLGGPTFLLRTVQGDAMDSLGGMTDPLIVYLRYTIILGVWGAPPELILNMLRSPMAHFRSEIC